MTQVAQSSSDQGSSTVTTSTVFNLALEADLLKLLRAIHRSPMKQPAKNELRDIIFALKQNDGQSQNVAISVLKEAGFEAVYGENQGADAAPAPEAATETEPAPAAPSGGFGRVRSQPRFAPATATASEPTPPAAEAPEPTPAPATTPEPPASEPAPAPAATPEPTPAPAPSTPAGSPNDDAAMNRIKEIKRLMNEKVGNPVALIDMDNQVGREYMNALLSAMKAVNGVEVGGLEAAMTRLEAAFSAAEKVIASAPAPAATPEPPAPEPAPAPEPVAPQAEPVPEPAAAPVTPPPPPPEPAPEPAPAAQSPLADGNPVKINVSPNIVSAPAADVAPSDVQPLQSAATAAPAPAAPTEEASAVPVVNRMSSAALSAAAPVAEVAASPTPVAAEQAAPAAPVADAASTRLMSVAKEEQLQNLMRQGQEQELEKQKATEEQMRATGDPLMMPEVTAGLKQLLSEWSLFKSSGFFGTGPGGMDHPLYKQMSGLTMAAVIAGRFEGATAQIKQSVTDYMNGWRYEEGITHDHNETFEHYLRRVIRHILDSKPVKLGE